MFYHLVEGGLRYVIMRAVKAALSMALAWWASTRILSVISQFVGGHAYCSLVSLIITPLILHTYTLLRDLVLETKYRLEKYRY
ncbi:MAG: hypothetical protein QXJ84_03250 [Desulfurococcaceae archaeon]